MGQELQKQPGGLPAESNTVSMFERLAKDPSVDVAKLEKLMELQERAIKRNAEAAYHAALAGMQCDIPSITEKGQIKHNDKLISKYALFEDINDQLKPILQRHGFAISFRTKVEGSTLTVTGVLSHREGHHEDTSLPLPFDTSGAKNAVQAIGSSVSYGKRYVMCALLNITTRGEDDDGKKGGAGKPISTEEACLINDMIREADTTSAKFLAYLNTEHKLALQAIEDIPAKVYPDALASLKGAITAHKRKAGKS